MFWTGKISGIDFLMYQPPHSSTVFSRAARPRSIFSEGIWSLFWSPLSELIWGRCWRLLTAWVWWLGLSWICGKRNDLVRMVWLDSPGRHLPKTRKIARDWKPSYPLKTSFTTGSFVVFRLGFQEDQLAIGSWPRMAVLENNYGCKFFQQWWVWILQTYSKNETRWTTILKQSWRL